MILNNSYTKVKKKTKSIFKDKRGYLIDIKKSLNFTPVHFLITYSKKNVLRGMHYQVSKVQNQAIYVSKGEIVDVLVDLRRNSKNFLKYKFYKLSEKSNKFIIIPKGFAHGYYALKNSIIHYYNSQPFFPKYDKGFSYKDKIINIKWPKGKKILSKKDSKLPSFEEIKNELF